MDLSVVIPAHNVADTLEAQLQALAEQGWDQAFEVVVVDNRSTDSTATIVRRWSERDPRIRLVVAPARASAGYARNVGIAAAKADRIALCDGDDVVAPGWVAAMAAALTEHALVTGRLEIDRLNPPWLAATRGRGDDRAEAPSFYGIFRYASCGNLGLQRSLWDEVGGFAEDMSGIEDVDLSLRARRLGVVPHFAPDAVLHYRYRAEAGALFRQGRTYGRWRPFVVRRLVDAGDRRPPRLAGWRSWAWLALHLPDLVRRTGRPGWCWVAGNRLGHLEGSLRHRTLLL